MLNNNENAINIDNEKEGLYIIMKKFYNLKPDREFRCFVINGKLVGIC